MCEECGAQYQVADEKIGEHGAKITCKKCGHTIIVKQGPSALEDEISVGDSSILDEAASAPAEAAAPAGEWYASLVNNQQVGPITLEELEAHWDALELSDESLCWKAGMGDWMPLAEIPELAFLVIRKPHAKVQESAPAAPVTPAANDWENNFSSPASGANVDWKPTGASDLAALVKEEVEASKRAEEEAKKAAEAAAIPAAPAGLAGLFGEGGAEGTDGGLGTGAAKADPFAAPANDPFAPKPQSAQAYNNYGGYPQPSSGGNKGLMIVIIVLLVALLGGGGFVYWNSMQKPATPPATAVAQAPNQPVAQQPVQQQAQQPVQQQAQQAAPVADANQGNQQNATPAADKAADNASASKDKDKAGNKHNHKNTTNKGKDTKTNTAKDTKANTAKGVKTTPAPAAASCDKQKIEGADVQNVVKAKLPEALKACLPAAKQRGEITSAFTLDVGFTVEKSGKLTSPQVRPAEIASTGFAECVKNKMRAWRFPSFCEGSAVPVKSIKVPIK